MSSEARSGLVRQREKLVTAVVAFFDDFNA